MFKEQHCFGVNVLIFVNLNNEFPCSTSLDAEYLFSSLPCYLLGKQYTMPAPNPLKDYKDSITFNCCQHIAHDVAVSSKCVPFSVSFVLWKDKSCL